MNKNPTLIIEKMAHGGAGISHLSDGRVCFVEGSLPGEEVEAVILKEKKDYALAKAVKILLKNPRRTEPRCPYFGKCGGCSLQHLTPEYQIQVAKETTEELFLRFAKEELPQDFQIVSGAPWHYRNRARFARYKKDWGFREQKSERIAVIEACPVLSAGLCGELEENRAHWDHVPEIDFFDNGMGRVSFYHPQMSESEFRQNSLNTVSLLGKTISMDASVFFQSNLGLLGELVRSVQSAAGKGRRLIDLFSGVGFFSVFLQEHFERVTAVERDAGCLFHARKNLSPTCEFVSESAETWLSQNLTDGADTLLVDPPRLGLSAEVRGILGGSSLERLLYVSCDPATLSRDYAVLREYGFQMESAQGFAFYPQTPHLEMLVTLVR
ncbi:MAG: TRAM domain-containing protein [Fibrobacter sp.]|jgi:23S rRNA (uracil1939-C5)-methyltransferase|nr:TRAM domain-containing protein [Fibrobacter sp.]